MAVYTLLLRLMGALLLLSLEACASGLAEFRLYGEAFDAQFVQGEKVLDRLAVAERIVMRRGRQLSNIRAFDPQDAPYYLNVGDPPLTLSIRTSLKAVREYNAALIGLADGTSATKLAAGLGQITNNLNTALASLPLADRAILAAGGEATIKASEEVISQALGVLKTASSFALRASFRRQLLRAYPAMSELLVRIRDGTDEMYLVMQRSRVEPGTLGGGSLGVPAAELPNLEQDRKLLAGWVVLLDQTLEAMDAAAAAALDGASPPDLAALVEASVQIRALAEGVKAAD
ncbi:hypothetical protein [Afifella sp. IM 167]|uniref:hypothetical protein n=1 Tax=Afifella sp. IM 167 TaxID=2033586 RepID=UPI001CCB250C|nr:hypothetical protein [Afifella sp. IM 167]MBZ8134393.1 hypothetical protein [Afifella sp. IM 167]